MNTLPLSDDNPEYESRIILEEELNKTRQQLQRIEEIAGIGHWQVDLLTGKIKWSDQFFRILGLDPGINPSTELALSTIHPEDRGLAFETYQRSILDCTPFRLELKIIRPTGEVRSVISEGNVDLNSEGKTIRLSGFFKDVTEVKREFSEFKNSNPKTENFLNSSQDLILFLNSSTDAFWALDRQYRLITANQAFFNLLEKTGNWKVQVGDKLLSEKYFEPEYIDLWKSIYDRAFSGETVTFDQNEKERGLSLHMEVEIKLISERGENQILACYAKDITDRKKEELKIEDLVDKLKMAQKIGKIGYWEFDPLTNKIFWSEEIYRIWEEDNSLVLDFDYFIQSIHPDDRENCLLQNVQAIREIMPLDYTHRIVLSDGRIKYIHEKGTPLVDKDGKLEKFQGTVQDITEQKTIEQELIDRNDFIESTLKNIPLGIAVNQISTGKVTFMNPAFIQIYGWPQETIKDVNTFLQKIYPDPEYHAFMSKTILEDIKSGDNERMSWKDVQITTQSGEQRIISAKNIALPDLDLMISTVINETDRYWAEESLKRSNERFHLATKAVSDAIWDWDIPTNSIFWGTGYSRLFGYPESMQNVPDDFWAEKIHPEDFSFIWNSILEARLNPAVDKWSQEYRFQRFDGSYAFVKENTVIIRNPEGEPIRMVGALQDISEEKEAQAALCKKSKLIETTAMIIQSLLELNDWQLMIEGSLKLMGETVNADRTYFFKNFNDPITGRLLSRQINEWTNDTVTSELDNPVNQAYPLDEHPDFLKSVYQKKPFEIFTSNCNKEHRVILEQQKIKSILQIPLFVDNQFYGYIGFDDCTECRIWNEDEKNFLQSISTNLAFAIERKQNLDKIQEAFESKNSILESIGDSFYAVDRDLTVTYWNKIAEEKTGIERDLIIGKNIQEYLSRFAKSEYSDQIKTALFDQISVHFEAYDDSLYSWNDVTIYPSLDGLSIFVRDITERKLAEGQIAEYNERLAIISEATNDAIWDWEITSGKHYWGDGFQKLFGLNPAIEGKSSDNWEKRVHPDDVERVRENTENLLKSNESTYFEIEYRFRKGDGTYAHVLDKGSLIRDKTKKPIRIVGAMQDISHRKVYEESLKILNEDLARSNEELEISNKELEQFAYVASHDLQEPLRMITSFLGLIEKKYSSILDEKGKQYIHHAVDGARRMRQIILDLLEFSRVGNIAEPKKWVSSRSLVEEVLLFNQKKIHDKKVKIHLEELPDISCHSSAVVQLFQNLISNAIKYQKSEAIPEIWIRGIDQVNFWEFIIKDNGIGIEKDYLTKIFIIFQRLHQKEEYSGSGIGLAICKKIVDIHGGKIWVESIYGDGSEFHFTIKK